MKTVKIVLITALCLILLGGCGFFTLTPTGRGIWNEYQHSLKKVDDATSYKTRKEVEDTCRASIASYNSSKTTYEQYKDSDSELERSWAESAKMQANRTANIYNNYILKNSYVFEGNIPNDICSELPIIE